VCVCVTLSGPGKKTVGCFQHVLRSLRKSTAALARPHQLHFSALGWMEDGGEGGLPGEL
jgi:hypothetical protein